ncbi:sulfotransferase [Flavobacteriaceae bacterium XHP0103]|uniref:sulfotransferase family protein n=1 Tax=Marixanthotalea marina TaxID=2844359 RepID=UPI0029899F0D|nr:sulfotransferase [Marixanthotalea marina]MBU3820657.1 sulfotransferase [Marixanthotalea marina]
MGKLQKKKKPNFLILGVPKAGTTSLYEYLKQHPEIFLPEKKELHFFSYNELKQRTNGPGDKSVLRELTGKKQQYLKLFENSENYKAIGEISPSYLFYFQKIKSQIFEILGKDIKVIVVIRNPISRTYSQYMHQKRLGYENLTFKIALNKEEGRKKNAYGDIWYYKTHSLYSPLLQEVYNSLHPNKIKIILFENLIQNPIATTQEIFNFLDVDETFIPRNINKKFNEGGIYKKGILSKFLAQPNRLKTLFKKFLPKKFKELLKQKKHKFLKTKKIPSQGMNKEEEIYLKKFFEKDVGLLKRLLKRNLEEWNHFNQK